MPFTTFQRGRRVRSVSHSPTSRPALKLPQGPVVGETGVASVLVE